MASPVILNPSFELGTAPGGGGYLTVNNGASDIQDWTVTGNSVDYISTYWVASDGSRSVDLSGNGPGGVSQSVSGFTVGGYYTLFFDMAGNMDGGSNLKDLLLKVTGETDQPYQFDTTGHSHGSMGWQQKSFSFYASATTLTLGFEFAGSGPFGAALDNLSITEDLSGLESVPEPGTFLLLGAGLTALALRSKRV
jgi:choice-of-anchor C domain-containing protein